MANKSLMAFIAVVLCSCLLTAFGLKIVPHTSQWIARTIQSKTSLNAVPMELSGQLDPKKSWEVSFVLEGVEKKVMVPEDMSLLEAAESLYDDAPSSCRNGVCTTCSAFVSEGRSNVKLAVHGLGKPQIDAGFICTCQGYAVGPGVKVELGKYDEVYETQYGQFELSYQSKSGKDDKKEVKKSFFGL